ncbi:MAG: type III-A CRISPR-associated protein Csm2 [Chloroherpetonaceae bacterium]|nr:type III-A CRISPR-associated protein Csm2 [Chloroherpetonaceae bacterium]
MSNESFDFTAVFGTLPKLDDVKNAIQNCQKFSELNDSDLLPNYAATVAKTIKVTSTQLNRFYRYVKSIEQANRMSNPDATTANDGFIDKHKLKFLLPKIAGSSERDSLKELYEIFAVSTPKIKTVSDLRTFVEFFEAILDYHSTFDTKKKDK